MGVSEKKYPADRFGAKKTILQGFFFFIQWLFVSAKKKNAVTRGFGKEYSFAHQITDTSPHPLKSQMVGPLGLLARINRS